MSSAEPIGGYFGLEPVAPTPTAFPYADALLLNSGRSCLQHVLSQRAISKVYLPAYTCDVIVEPLTKLGVGFEFYDVSDQLELLHDIPLADSELLLFTNYFGVKDAYCTDLGARYGQRLVLDCAQAFYFSPLPQGHTFYSPRKFFGVSDGGCLVGPSRNDADYPVDDSAGRDDYLTIRLEQGAEAGYDTFRRSDASLSDEPVKRMSPQTRERLAHIDYEAVRTRRRDNFQLLHASLGPRNPLHLDLGELGGPMVYPYWSNDPSLRQRLIDSKVFVATYWPNVLQADPGSPAARLAQHLLPLPIDQRYGPADMRRILDLIA